MLIDFALTDFEVPWPCDVPLDFPRRRHDRACANAALHIASADVATISEIGGGRREGRPISAEAPQRAPKRSLARYRLPIAPVQGDNEPTDSTTATLLPSEVIMCHVGVEQGLAVYHLTERASCWQSERACC